MIYTGVGSRKTPIHILQDMILIGERLAFKGWTLRSGRAQGADQAFERGCDISKGLKEIFLPWPDFPGDGHYDYPEKFLTSKIVANWPTQQAKELAFRTLGQPHWQRLTSGGQLLHSRNAHQVLGLDLNQPASMLICWAKPLGTGVEGGTGTALKLAQTAGIHCYNLFHKTDREAVLGMLY